MSRVYLKLIKFLRRRKILILLLLAFLFRLFLLPYGTHPSDMGLWKYWGEKMVQFGPGQFYQKVGWCDYLPFYLYFLGGVELVWRFLSQFMTVSKEVLHKLPATLADLGTAYLIYLFLKKRKRNLALFIAGIYLFNPAIFGNSSLWGQVDSLGAFLVLAASYFSIQKKPVITGILIGFSLMMKPLYLMTLPIFVFLAREKLRKFISATLASVLLIVLPFSGLEPLILLWERYKAALSQYPYTSVNAFNFWAIGNRWWQPDSIRFLSLTYQNWGLAIFGLVYLLIMVYLWQSRKKRSLIYSLFLSLSTIFAALFVFPTRVHERHLFNVFPFLAILIIENSQYWLPFILFSITYALNLYFSYFWLINGGKFPFSWNIINALSVVNVLLAIGLAVIVFKRLKINWKKVRRLLAQHRLLILFLFLSLWLRFWRLGYPPNFYFDEVYHAFTAKEVAKGNVAAWEWWNTPPKGFAYEWTHPPLAKLGMAAGILLFGENAFGWRFAGALLGVGCVLLVYLIGKKLFNQKVALFASFLFAFDGLPLVMSRIGMNDIYFLFFALLALYLFLKEKLLFSGIAFGLSLSSKWTAIYLLPVLGLSGVLGWLGERKKDWFTFFKLDAIRYTLYAILLPSAIYFLSYLPFFLTNHSLNQWWELQKQMWWYHTRLSATHSFTSPWWSWPILARPVWFFVNYPSTSLRMSLIANIYAMGNPVVWWGGLISLPFVIWQTLKTRNYQLGLIVFAYFAFFLPWAISPRIMFIYHYLPSVAFLCLFLGWILNWTQKKKQVRQLVTCYLLLVILSFLFFYPHWTGVHVPKWLDKLYYWFTSWK